MNSASRDVKSRRSIIIFERPDNWSDYCDDPPEGQAHVPLVIRTMTGAGFGPDGQDSDCLEV